MAPRFVTRDPPGVEITRVRRCSGPGPPLSGDLFRLGDEVVRHAGLNGPEGGLGAFDSIELVDSLGVGTPAVLHVQQRREQTVQVAHCTLLAELEHVFESN